jgi:hypothetical protein
VDGTDYGTGSGQARNIARARPAIGFGRANQSAALDAPIAIDRLKRTGQGEKPQTGTALAKSESAVKYEIATNEI